MNSYNLLEVQSILNKVHPKQIVNRVDNLKMTMFVVKYEYTTNRNNRKQGTKYFLLNTFNPQANLELELNEWVNDYNDKNKHRQISNVKFLESQCLGYLNI